MISYGIRRAEFTKFLLPLSSDITNFSNYRLFRPKSRYDHHYAVIHSRVSVPTEFLNYRKNLLPRDEIRVLFLLIFTDKRGNKN